MYYDNKRLALSIFWLVCITMLLYWIIYLVLSRKY